MVTKENLNTYVVVADAVTVSTGKRPNGQAKSTRLAMGGVINGTASSEQIQHLLQLGGIKQFSGDEELAEIRADLSQEDPRRSKHRLSGRRAHKRQNSSDQALLPVKDILPAPAPLPEHVSADSE